jgi:sRNA-binding protein
MGTRAQLERIHETLDFLRRRFPKAFSRHLSEIRPLKPGILDDIVAELGAEEFRQPVKHALAYYQVRIHYLSKVVSGKWYRDLYGNRCGLVPLEAKENAARKRDNIMANNRPNIAD